MNPSTLEWAVRAEPMVGEMICGDGHCVRPIDDTSWLVAVIDGLGHGPHARDATEAVVSCLESHRSESLDELFRACHDAVRQTRGAAVTVARIDTQANRMTWFGVGNVEALILGAEGERRRHAPLRGGIVGYRMPPLRVETVEFKPKDLLVMTTDGVRASLEESLWRQADLEACAAEILRLGAKDEDDSLVLLARITEQ